MSQTPRELLSATTIDAMPVEVRQHAYNANAIRLAKSLGDATGLTQIGAHLITLEPGRESSEYHRHLYEEEFVYVLSGTGQLLLDDRPYDIGPGDFLGFPRGGAAHVVKNTGETPLLLLVAGQRLEQDICDYPHFGKRLYIHGQGEDLVDFEQIKPG